MRTTRVVIGIVIIACCAANASAAESGSRWWPFGKKDDPLAEPPKAATPTTTPPMTREPSASAARPAVQPSIPPAAGATAATTTTEPATKDHWMFSTPSGKVSWPQWNMPKSGLLADKSTPDPAKNSWVEPPTQPKPSAFKPITDGAHKFSASTKNAWNKTVSAVKGEQTATPPPNGRSAGNSRVAKREVDPPFWKRMFGAKPALQGPQTVPEWMAQQRLDP